jgi:hypothetical protein
MLVAGTLIYNEIVVVPFFGFNQYTKVAIAERDGTLGKNSGVDYMATSPGAAYDNNRNVRGL